MAGSCATCRRKSRRCGRERPACSACLAKGDECEGYPVRFCGLASRGRLSGRSQYPELQESPPPPSKRRRVSSPRPDGARPPSGADPDENPRLVHLMPAGASDYVSNAIYRSHLDSVDSPHYQETHGSQATPESLFDTGGLRQSSPNTTPAAQLVDSSQVRINIRSESITTRVSPMTSISVRTRDDELLQPLEAVLGPYADDGPQTRLHGLHLYPPWASASDVDDYPLDEAPPKLSPPRRLSWAARLAAVRLDALPSLSLGQGVPDPSPTLDPERVCFLLEYFDHTVCPRLVVSNTDTWHNPFRQHLLPLTLQFSGVLYAVLGLSMGHFAVNQHDSAENEQESLQYRLSAIRQVITWLEELETDVGDPIIIEAGLAIILILVLHDVCETGVSADGVHLDGVTSICHRQSSTLKEALFHRPCIKFLLGALSWLHMLRYVSGDNKLMLPGDIWIELHHHMCPRLFECFTGCPKDLFVLFIRILRISREPSTVETANRQTSKGYYEEVESLRQELLAWKLPNGTTPSSDHHHRHRVHLTDAFRHGFLLHSLRLLDRYSTPSSPRVQNHVNAILDAAARLPAKSPLARRLLWPMFVAGTEAAAAHQHDYISIRADEIRADTGFRNLASTAILGRVWKERVRGTRRDFEGDEPSRRTWSWSYHVSFIAALFSFVKDKK